MHTHQLAPIQLSRQEKESEEANYWEAQWVGDDPHHVFQEGHNSRRCPLKRNEKAEEQHAEEQPQEPQPAEEEPAKGAQPNAEQQLKNHVNAVSE
ncbi:hypothetical protein PIB30_091212 [Stylosanthes scabra]|uniref:Uncharacterized protein n=1 Tax=Stylosanthes scabra TaxID=79078 RepID=A0ABU6ZTS9_9FABA|nr:hypothetical protein [Stylosanthes scabra]